ADALLDAANAGAIVCVTGPAEAAAPAIDAACQAQNLPTTWVRPGPAKGRTQVVKALYTALNLDHLGPQPRALAATLDRISTELRRSNRLVIVADAHRLPTEALELLYGLWKPGGTESFPLILVGEDHLHNVLRRPALASLHSCVHIRHRLAPQPAPTPENHVSPAAPNTIPAQDNTAAPAGDLRAHLHRATENRSVLVVTGQNPDATAILTETLDAAAIQPARVQAMPLDQLVAGLFKQLSLGKRSPRDPATAVVKITAEMRRTPHPIVVEAAHNLPPDALRWLYLLWTSSAFPLVLVGDDERLGDLLAQPTLSGLRDGATIHQVVVSAPPPAPVTEPAGPDHLEPSVPSPSPAAAPVAEPIAEPAVVPEAEAAAHRAAVPTTLHEARAALPQLIKAATAGEPTPLARGTHHAVLTSPANATAAGWDLAGADVHGTADARKKLGDLIQAAALGRPQVLRRHVTPLAVLLPASPDGAPRPPAAPVAAAPVVAPAAVPASAADSAVPASAPATPAAVVPPVAAGPGAAVPPAAPASPAPAAVPAAPGAASVPAAAAAAPSPAPSAAPAPAPAAAAAPGPAAAPVPAASAAPAPAVSVPAVPAAAPAAPAAPSVSRR
ncbi:AAA family ATPase, partial [Streptacidiphilus jiangxiensis]